jgi:hypothetical protein
MIKREYRISSKHQLKRTITSTQWATKWTLGEKSQVHFCKIQLVLDILRTMDYLMALKVLLQSSSRVKNERIENN